MNLLQLAHRLPWPPVDGGKKGTLGFVQGYARHPAVLNHHLLCICPIEEEGWLKDWQATGVKVEAELMDVRNQPGKVLWNTFFSRLPFNMEKYRRRAFEIRLERSLKTSVPDVVHFDSLHMAAYAPLVRALAPNALLILRCHNAEHVILDRLATQESNVFKRWVIGLQAARLKRYEAHALGQFDLVLAITEADAARFRKMAPELDGDHMLVIPAGADLPMEIPQLPSPGDGVFRLVHIAAMDWIPNVDGLRWLLKSVLPILDRAGLRYHLDVVGKNMPPEFLGWSHPCVKVHGFVEDLSAILRASQLAVVPLKVGGGMRVKILDYWAQGIPVLSTAVGAEGLFDPSEQPSVLALAETAQEFADQIQRLAHNPTAIIEMRSAAFTKVSAQYGWTGIVDHLISLYQSRLSHA